MQTFHLFISHSWTYCDTHDPLLKLLAAHPMLTFKHFSMPPDPITGALTAQQAEEVIENQIRPCSAVLIMAGLYATYSQWINQEIAIAKRLGKVIIAIKPFGAPHMSPVIREAAHAQCSWSTGSIMNAIREHESGVSRRRRLFFGDPRDNIAKARRRIRELLNGTNEEK